MIHRLHALSRAIQPLRSSTPSSLRAMASSSSSSSSSTATAAAAAAPGRKYEWLVIVPDKPDTRHLRLEARP